MIVCPSCHHRIIAGALFCDECGSQLVPASHVTTQSIRQSIGMETNLAASPEMSNQSTPAQSKPLGDVHISLILMDSGQVLNLVGRNEFTMGRVGDKQPILPDIDLTNYDAYTQGVSRLHAALKINDSDVAVTDLGSSNGTRVNGQKIMPHIDYPLKHGDIVALGKLKIQILIRRG